jgi:hypothetical protein
MDVLACLVLCGGFICCESLTQRSGLSALRKDHDLWRLSVLGLIGEVTTLDRPQHIRAVGFAGG